jgi:hypothetical protein
MKVEFLTIKQIEINKFEITTLVDGEKRFDLITFYTDIPVEGLPNMQRLVAEKPDFDEIWASSFAFRQKISRKIKEFTRKSQKRIA